jgi:hypothetical protein
MKTTKMLCLLGVVLGAVACSDDDEEVRDAFDQTEPATPATRISDRAPSNACRATCDAELTSCLAGCADERCTTQCAAGSRSCDDSCP